MTEGVYESYVHGMKNKSHTLYSCYYEKHDVGNNHTASIGLRSSAERIHLNAFKKNITVQLDCSDCMVNGLNNT